MTPATQIAQQEIDRKLVNLLVAGSNRVGRLLDEGRIDDAKELCKRINTVCSPLGGNPKGQDFRVSLEAIPSAADISAVYDTAEFKLADGSVDCSPLCWNDSEKACVVC